MGPSEFYSSVPNTAGDLFMDPMAMDLAAPTTVPLAAPGNTQHLLGSIVLDYSHRECDASFQEGKAAADEGQSGSEEDQSDSDTKEEYLAQLEVAVAESEPAREQSPPPPACTTMC